MIRDIDHDVKILSKKSTPASKNDIAIVQDLVDTLTYHRDHCVGMAANMIGKNKCIIACQFGPLIVAMINPVITKKSQKYSTSEGCLSLTGERETTRFNKIEVSYLNQSFQKVHATFEGFNAQIIQHEIDHCNGILI